RHEPLRTVFVADDGVPYQRVLPRLDLQVPKYDLSDLAPIAREHEIRRLIQAEAEQLLDLAHGPLLRVAIASSDTEHHVLLLTLHHILYDGWSLGLLLREMSALYAAFGQGMPSPLAPLAIQYADYAAWEQTHLSGEQLARRLSYWRGNLSGAGALLDLPID